MIDQPPTFREALRVTKPPLARRILGKVWPLRDVISWQVREEMLDDLARDLGRRLPLHTVDLIADLQAMAGRDWPSLLRELEARWARA